MFRRVLPAIFLCAAVSACSGGGSSSSGLPQTASKLPTAPVPTQSVTIAITIPALPVGAASKARHPLYVSASTLSASIAVNGGPAVITSLAPGATNCSTGTGSGGGRTCTIAVNAPAGSDTLAVALFASADGSGPVLSQNTSNSTVNVVAGQTNTISMVLNGVVASIVLSVNPATSPTGKAATIALTATTKDAAGRIILSDPFSNPILLTDSDTTGATVLSKPTLDTPADQSTIAYNGAAIASAVFSATSAGVPSANITSATFTPTGTTIPPSTLVDWPTYAYDAQRTGFNPSSNALTPTTVGQLHLAWQVSVGGGSQPQPVIATNVAGHRALLIVASYKTVQAFDALSGSRVWSTNVPIQNYQDCGTAGTAGTVQYDAALGAVFIATGNGLSPNHIILQRLDVATGNITGSTDVTPILLTGESVGAHTAVTMANGKLYLGTGSNCEGTSGDRPAWRGRVVAVDPASMTLLNTFFTTFGQGANYAGGGVWSWGGVSVDPSGNVYVATGNAATNQTIHPGVLLPPFAPTTNEQAGYAEHLVKLNGDLSAVEDSDYPGFNFNIGYEDLDYAGTPVVYQPPIGSNCGLLTATQGKGGTLVINSTQRLSPALNSFALSVPSAAAFYVGNPGYSPVTGYLYAAITSSGNGSSMMPPGLAAIQGCGSSIAWHTSFGSDSTAFGDNAHAPRTAPTVTAGGVVLLGTPCTSDGHGGCSTPNPNAISGAVWAVDASSGNLLGGGKPILTTSDTLRMAPTVDGQWMWVIDNSGNVYGLTIDPSVKSIAALATVHAASHVRIRSRY